MKVITTSILRELSAQASASERLRVNWNLHPALGDPVQRFLNAIEPGSYVRPHRHCNPSEKWELFVILSGAALVLLLDEAGKVLARVELAAAGEQRVVEIPAGAWHTLAALQPATVLFEVKQGPYSAMSDKDFAAWAPLEGSAGAHELVSRYLMAQVGDSLLPTMS